LEELSKILETAEGLFRKYGVRSVTMTDISYQLGISKKTLYNVIENKEDLISKIMLLYIEREKKESLEIATNATDALDEMLKISVHVQRNIQDMNPSLLFDLKKYHNKIWNVFESYRRDFILMLMEKNIERGIKEGIYRPEIDASIMSRIHVGTVEIFSDEILLPPERFPRTRVHIEFALHFLHGLITEKGKRLFDEYLKHLNNII
jgi:AcrR family transcriptional regulator